MASPWLLMLLTWFNDKKIYKPQKMAQGVSQLPLLDAQTKSQSLFYQDLAQFLEGVLQEPQACFQPEALSSGDLAS